MNLAQTSGQVLLILVAAAIAFVAVRLALGAAVQHLLERHARQQAEGLLTAVEMERRIRTLQRLASRVIGAVIVIVASLMVLDRFAINIGPAIAGLGVIGIAVGLGAQTLVKDWLAGIFIVIENQYSAGDLVRIAGVEGKVEDFSLRRTTLRDADGTVHSVPNGQIIVASNLSRGRHPVSTNFGTGRQPEAIDPAEPPARK
ncbi:MAG: mechanosensitive ion channel domain-containing protein [Chloroflexota bacterium]